VIKGTVMVGAAMVGEEGTAMGGSARPGESVHSWPAEKVRWAEVSWVQKC
jgi:hypothetical protein